MADSEIDLRAAINAISDVVQNRPRPLREFDQIYMKTGDMVLQSEIVASWADGKRLAFIGDGDAISICVAYLKERGIINYGPSKITVFDFDERICNAVCRFAENEHLETLDSVLYNCLDVFPQVGEYDCFYTNPPWGASNKGESVHVFVQRGMEAVTRPGEGLIVIADDPVLEWPQNVLASTQQFFFLNDFFVSKLQPNLHLYHLDDAPNLRSCNLFIKSQPNATPCLESVTIDDKVRLDNFYGRNRTIHIQYVREKSPIDYGKANETEYYLEKRGLDEQ